MRAEVSPGSTIPDEVLSVVPVDVSAVSHLDDVHDESILLDGVENAIRPLAKAVAFLAAKPGRADGTGILCQRFDLPDDPPTIRLS